MPEGPEIKRAADRIAHALTGRRLEEVWFGLPRLMRFSATDISLLTPEEELFHPYLSRLGPDVLDPVLTWRDVSRRLNQPRFHNRALGSLYLDQGFLAGIGNYLRSEILFAAGLHPACKPRELAVKTRNHLARQTLLIAGRAYETGGITNAPERVAALKAHGLSRRRYRFAVFARDGEPCSACGTPIARMEVGSRRLYLCATCQPSQQRGDGRDRRKYAISTEQ